MKNSLQIASAFIGLIIGAGFASGQEILQFFTSFGWLGIAGTVVATLLFGFLAMNLAQLGCRLQTKSHKEVVYHICGKYLGVVVDFIITFFLFGVTVVMMAGSGAIFEQQFGLPGSVGNIIMAALVIATVCLNVHRVISIIGIVTPFLLVAVIIITTYSFFTMDMSMSELKQISQAESAAASNWALGAFLYVSYNLAAGAAMLTVMGGTVKDEKAAGMGGILGGLGLGLLILLINLGMLVKLDQLQGIDMPTLFLANEISPILAGFMSIILLGMIFNTAVGMLYAFSARFVSPSQPKFKVTAIGSGILAFIASFVGFIQLVGTVYPVMGYLGFTIIAAIVVAWIRMQKNKNNHSIQA
ncbi:YkvI family membrane protein [Calidifontibacillus oryziterrae]|uniref:YkvI family membrane protein n=1 Tax=Calidifontibacillus oryziterrae TaxID=1191699 RepID=UPI0002EA6C49|nr:hypothetical protein [Calidifontibacillus oryziterrae]